MPFRYGAPVWSLLPDGHWLLFDRDPRPDVTDYVVTPLTRDTTEVPTFPSTDAEGRPWLGMTWFGEHSVLVWSPRETAMVALDLPTATEIWRLSHTGRQPPSRASTTPDRASVLLWSAVDGNAMLLHLRSGAPPTVTRLDGLLAAGNDECSGLDVPAEELFYGQEEVVPSPTNDGFRVSFGTGYSRVIKTVDLDGRIELLSSCVRRESPFIDDGRFAYAGLPAAWSRGSGARPDRANEGDRVRRARGGRERRFIPPPPLRLSDDGRWIESLFDTGGRVNLVRSGGWVGVSARPSRRTSGGRPARQRRGHERPHRGVHDLLARSAEEAARAPRLSNRRTKGAPSGMGRPVGADAPPRR